MMLKFLLLVVVMFFAAGIAAIMLRRMMSISERIADLHNDMKKSQVRLESQMQILEDERQKTEGHSTHAKETDEIEEKNS